MTIVPADFGVRSIAVRRFMDVLIPEGQHTGQTVSPWQVNDGWRSAVAVLEVVSIEPGTDVQLVLQLQGADGSYRDLGVSGSTASPGKVLAEGLTGVYAPQPWRALVRTSSWSGSAVYSVVSALTPGGPPY